MSIVVHGLIVSERVGVILVGRQGGQLVVVVGLEELGFQVDVGIGHVLSKSLLFLLRYFHII